MKKKDLAILAMLGISTGLLVSGCAKSNKSSNLSADEQKAPVDAGKFYNMLSDEGKKKFDQLDDKHKKAAVMMFNQSCKGQNSCAGLGGCDTSAHECAGKNDCKGQGGAPIKDAISAVKVQYDQQLKERGKASQSMQQSAK